MAKNVRTDNFSEPLNGATAVKVEINMERRMLLGLKARAEGRPDAPIALMAIAQLGWVAAGITVQRKNFPSNPSRDGRGVLC